MRGQDNGALMSVFGIPIEDFIAIEINKCECGGSMYMFLQATSKDIAGSSLSSGSIGEVC